MSEQPVHAPKGDVKLPGLGPVPKKWFIIVGGGSVLVIGYVLIRRKKTAAATPAAATDTGTTALSGQPCVDSNGNPGVYDDTGTCQTDTDALGGYYAGYGAEGVSGVTAPVAGTGGFVTNGQWTQQVITDIQSLGTGVDVPTLTAALGAYIAGQPLTPAQQSLVDQAIAIDGYPPVAGANGYPPAMMTGATAPVTTTPTGTTSAKAPPAVTGLKAVAKSPTSIALSWTASSTATSYQVRVTYQTPTAPGGGLFQTDTATGTTYTVTGLTPDHTYGLHVVAINSSGQASEASTTCKTPKG